MVSRAAGHDINLADTADHLIIQTDLRQIQLALPDNGVQCICDCLRLLMDLLHHEMLKTGFLRCFCIPLNDLRLLLDLLTVQIEKSDLTRFYTCQLHVSDIINIPCILQDRRNIRCDIGFSILHTQDHRAVFSRYKDLFRIITEHHCQRIGTTDTHHGMTHCLNRRAAVFLVVIIHQLHSNLRICRRIKRISPAEKLLLQFLVILDNAVMYSCHISVITDMGMGIDLRRLSVSCPAGMTDPAHTRNRLTCICFLQKDLQTSLRLDDLDILFPVTHCDAGGIISPVF